MSRPGARLCCPAPDGHARSGVMVLPRGLVVQVSAIHGGHGGHGGCNRGVEDGLPWAPCLGGHLLLHPPIELASREPRGDRALLRQWLLPAGVPEWTPGTAAGGSRGQVRIRVLNRGQAQPRRHRLSCLYTPLHSWPSRRPTGARGQYALAHRGGGRWQRDTSSARQGTAHVMWCRNTATTTRLCSGSDASQSSGKCGARFHPFILSTRQQTRRPGRAQPARHQARAYALVAPPARGRRFLAAGCATTGGTRPSPSSRISYS